MKTRYTLAGLSGMAGVVLLAAGCAICSDNSRPSLLGGDADFSLLNTRNSRTVTKAIDADGNSMPGTSTAAAQGGGSLTLGAEAMTNIVKAVEAGVLSAEQVKTQSVTMQAMDAKPVLPPVKYYTVEKGDCLSTIAQEFGCSVKALKKANGLKSDIIQPGQWLTIP